MPWQMMMKICNNNADDRAILSEIGLGTWGREPSEIGVKRNSSDQFLGIVSTSRNGDQRQGLRWNKTSWRSDDDNDVVSDDVKPSISFV